MNKKHIIGWGIGTLSAIGLLSGTFIVPASAQELYLTIVAGLSAIGTTSYILFLPVMIKKESKQEKIQKDLSNAHVTEKGIEPEKVFEQLHANTNTATFKGDHNSYVGYLSASKSVQPNFSNAKDIAHKDNHIYLLDNRRSAITPKEIKKYKSESASVTPQIKSVTDTSTFELAEIGSAQMKSDRFKLTQLPDDTSSLDKGEGMEM